MQENDLQISSAFLEWWSPKIQMIHGPQKMEPYYPRWSSNIASVRRKPRPQRTFTHNIPPPRTWLILQLDASKVIDDANRSHVGTLNPIGTGLGIPKLTQCSPAAHFHFGIRNHLAKFCWIETLLYSNIFWDNAGREKSGIAGGSLYLAASFKAPSGLEVLQPKSPRLWKICSIWFDLPFLHSDVRPLDFGMSYFWAQVWFTRGWSRKSYPFLIHIYQRPLRKSLLKNTAPLNFTHSS